MFYITAYKLGNFVDKLPRRLTRESSPVLENDLVSVQSNLDGTETRTVYLKLTKDAKPTKLASFIRVTTYSFHKENAYQLAYIAIRQYSEKKKYIGTTAWDVENGQGDVRKVTPNDSRFERSCKIGNAAMNLAKNPKEGKKWDLQAYVEEDQKVDFDEEFYQALVSDIVLHADDL